MNNELMFIYGFTLMTITCTVVMVEILSYKIASIWHKKIINKGVIYE